MNFLFYVIHYNGNFEEITEITEMKICFLLNGKNDWFSLMNCVKIEIKIIKIKPLSQCSRREIF